MSLDNKSYDAGAELNEAARKRTELPTAKAVHPPIIGLPAMANPLV